MARPPRFLLPGAVYHVTSRGNRRANIYTDERDYLIWMDTLAEAVQRHAMVVHAWCQMPNHYHLLVQTSHANLSDGMHFLNSTYAHHFNARHGLSGHVVQGRYHAVLVESDAQLLATARYVALNPVRANLVGDPQDWRWGSHRFMCQGFPPPWLTTKTILSEFGNANPLARHVSFVLAGIGGGNPLSIPAATLKADLLAMLQAIHACSDSIEQAIAHAHASGWFTRKQIADYFSVSVRKINRASSAQARGRD